MAPLGFIADYESFKREMGHRLEAEEAIGFLLDCPRRELLKRSGLIESPRSVEGFNRLMSDRMSIYYLSPLQLKRQKTAEAIRSGTSPAATRRTNRTIHERFNELILSGLQIPYRVDLPCLLLFRPQGSDLTNRKYYPLGEDSCFYYNDLYQVISSYCHPTEDSAQAENSLLGQIRETYKSIKEDLPKTVITNSLLALENYVMNL